MKRYSKFWCALVTVMILCSLGTGYAQLQTWESNGGHKVEAEFVQITEGTVVLQKPDGEKVRVPLGRLSEASMARAEALWETQSKYFPQHVYTMQTYDFGLFGDGKMYLQPKHVGIAQGDPISIRFNGGVIPARGRWKARPIVKLSDPVISANALTLKMELEEGIQVTLHCIVEADTLTIGYEVMEPEGVETGSYQVILLMPAILETDPDSKLMQGFMLNQPVPYKAIEPYLEGISLRAVSEKRTETIPYYDSPDAFKGRQEYVLLSGALGRNSKFKVSAGKNGYLAHLIYPGKMLWSGYSLYLEKNSDNDDAMGSSNEFKIKLTY
ncbi:SHD1 domain-containing protein [Kiritimatiellota bacterium B12222]|nr:SHD1 domain-containing protein [Kiritimatiellota bacterium B12222]